MPYKLINENGIDVIASLEEKVQTQEKQIKTSQEDITRLRETILEQKALIDKLMESVIDSNERVFQLQDQVINLHNSTLADVIKNTFKKKSNIKQSVIEIDD